METDKCVRHTLETYESHPCPKAFSIRNKNMRFLIFLDIPWLNKGQHVAVKICLGVTEVTLNIDIKIWNVRSLFWSIFDIYFDYFVQNFHRGSFVSCLAYFEVTVDLQGASPEALQDRLV